MAASGGDDGSFGNHPKMDDDNEESGDEGGSDDSDDSDSEDGDPSILYPDPLSLIDSNADLDAVLAAKTIGEAIQLLCPNMPGLPCKQRGKYKKRRNLTEEEKDQIMRARNRDNARRTRKRKKLYIAFLNKALEALENVLNPREPEAVKTENNVDIGSSSSSVDVPADDGGEDDDNSSPSVILANRLQTMRSFLSLRSSPSIDSEMFAQVCAPDILHSMPLPAHRDLSSLANISDLYECRGIDAVIDDTRKRASFCDTLLRWSGADMQNWIVEADIDVNDVMLNATGDKISIQYSYKIYMIPISLDPNEPNPPKDKWKLDLTVPVVCLADFDNEGKLCNVEEQFDVLDIIRQRDLCASGGR